MITYDHIQERRVELATLIDAGERHKIVAELEWAIAQPGRGRIRSVDQR